MRNAIWAIAPALALALAGCYGEGWVPALGQDERPTFSAADENCEARFTIDSHGLRGVAYADSLGRPIPQAERCEIAVRRCLGDPRS
jgi:hypothetical protein